MRKEYLPPKDRDNSKWWWLLATAGLVGLSFAGASDSAKRFVRERAGGKCESCGEKVKGEGIVGHLDQDRLNVDGGAIAMGHPVGASGARIVLHLLHVLRRKQAKRGVATICIGGGQGGSMLIEPVY